MGISSLFPHKNPQSRPSKKKTTRKMTAARVIVVMAAAACAGAAQAGGESLRSHIAATQQQVDPPVNIESVGCRTSKTNCPDGTTAAHGFCCYKKPVDDRCTGPYQHQKELGGYIRCDNIRVACSSIGSYPKC
jgi:hypothetical protein